jgi:hypothetical protein
MSRVGDKKTEPPKPKPVEKPQSDVGEAINEDVGKRVSHKDLDGLEKSIGDKIKKDEAADLQALQESIRNGDIAVKDQSVSDRIQAMLHEDSFMSESDAADFVSENGDLFDSGDLSESSAGAAAAAGDFDQNAISDFDDIAEEDIGQGGLPTRPAEGNGWGVSHMKELIAATAEANGKVTDGQVGDMLTSGIESNDQINDKEAKVLQEMLDDENVEMSADAREAIEYALENQDDVEGIQEKIDGLYASSESITSTEEGEVLSPQSVNKVTEPEEVEVEPVDEGMSANLALDHAIHQAAEADGRTEFTAKDFEKALAEVGNTKANRDYVTKMYVEADKANVEAGNDSQFTSISERNKLEKSLAQDTVDSVPSAQSTTDSTTSDRAVEETEAAAVEVATDITNANVGEKLRELGADQKAAGQQYLVTGSEDPAYVAPDSEAAAMGGPHAIEGVVTEVQELPSNLVDTFLGNFGKAGLTDDGLNALEKEVDAMAAEEQISGAAAEKIRSFVGAERAKLAEGVSAPSGGSTDTPQETNDDIASQPASAGTMHMI